MKTVDFSELYERYWPDVYRFCVYLCGNPTTAKDIASETFVRAWTVWDRIRVETVKAYLFTIARNLYLQGARGQVHHLELQENVEDRSASPVKTFEVRAELADVIRQLQTFAEVDRTAFLMRVIDEMSYDDIARALELSPAAVRVKVHRVRLKLARSREEGVVHESQSRSR